MNTAPQLDAHGVAMPQRPSFIDYWLSVLTSAAFARARVQQYRGFLPRMPGARASARAQGYSNVRHMQRELAAAKQQQA